MSLDWVEPFPLPTWHSSRRQRAAVDPCLFVLHASCDADAGAEIPNGLPGLVSWLWDPGSGEIWTSWPVWIAVEP